MRKRKILIVDDELDMLEILKLNLENSGHYEVMVGHKAAEGLKIANEFEPDLILLDFIMPGMNGNEFVDHIKSSDALKNTPIVFFTATADRQDPDIRSLLDKYPFISKPASYQEVVDCIEKNLQI